MTGPFTLTFNVNEPFCVDVRLIIACATAPIGRLCVLSSTPCTKLPPKVARVNAARNGGQAFRAFDSFRSFGSVVPFLDGISNGGKDVSFHRRRISAAD